MKLAGVVLAGGRSTRMGTPKAWLDWHGMPLLERTCRTVARGTGGGPLVVVRAPGQELPALPDGTVVVEDAAAGRGPLQGLLQGLATLDDAADAAFVASTDAALLHPALVRAVAEGLRDADAAIPLVRGHRHLLGAVYRTRLAALAAQLLADGERRLGLLSERCTTHWLDEAALLTYAPLAHGDPGLESLENLNDPGAYDAARARPLPPVQVTVGGAPHTANAATLGALVQAIGSTLDGLGAPVVNGDRVPSDPRFPLAAGDLVAFEPTAQA